MSVPSCFPPRSLTEPRSPPRKEEGEKAAAAVAKAQGAKRGSKAVKPEEAVVV